MLLIRYDQMILTCYDMDTDTEEDDVANITVQRICKSDFKVVTAEVWIYIDKK